MQSERFIGALSGTSLDGVDLVLTEISDGGKVTQLDAINAAIPESLQHELQQLCQPGDNEIIRLGQADRRFAETVAEGVHRLLQRNQLPPNAIRAIGHHGQTIRHHPELTPSFSLQLGCNHTLATLTQIDVIGQFRQKDLALGGEGAPLAPLFHHWLFADQQELRIVANIGGIANISILPAKTVKAPILGYDTGPGNTLLDYWTQEHHQQAYDMDGCWAASGSIHSELLDALMRDPYFHRAPPKSTGREYFTPTWLRRHLSFFAPISAADVQATLVECTAKSLTQAIRMHLTDHKTRVYVCGGGVHNKTLMARFQALLPEVPVRQTDALGIHPDWVEGCLFAWLAWCYMQGMQLDLRDVTGASRPARLGALFPKD